MAKQYHHGNLKNELIEHGIRIIAESGVEQLSLRSLSKECGVSHNAIYRHFESKNKMIESCRGYVTEKLTECLNAATEELNFANDATLKAFSLAYAEFFRENTLYFGFLYNDRTCCKISLLADGSEGNYPPFEIFGRICSAIGERQGLSGDESRLRMIRRWALMQGAVSLMISPNVSFDGDKTELIENILGKGELV